MRDDGMTGRVVDALYTEAMLLTDEVRAYFDDLGRADRDALLPLDRVIFVCESLRVTTRLTHVIAWVLARRAVGAGEIDPAGGHDPARRLCPVESVGPAELAVLPAAARQLIAASDELHRRVRQLEAQLDTTPHSTGPARGLIARLEGAF